MLIYLYNLLQKIITYNLYYFLLFFITLLLLLFSYSLFKFKFNFIDYKIYNFKLNSFFISIYIFIFIFSILFLRYLKMGTKLDLKDFVFKLKVYFNEFTYLGKINIILIVIILILILNIIKRFFYYQIKKRHLYYYHKSLYKTTKYFVRKQQRQPIKYWDYDFYVTMVHNFSEFGYYSYYYIHSFRVRRKISKTFYFFYKILKKKMCKKDPRTLIWLQNSIEVLLKMLPYILFVIYLFHDIIYNNYHIYLLYYYLPFFFIYQIWKSICLFLEKSNSILDQIIYDLYYENNTIFYVDVLEVEYNFILTYIKNNFVCYSYKKDIKNFEMWLLYSNYLLQCCHDIRKQLYYLLEKDITKIKNPYTGDELDLKNIEIIETWPLLKIKNTNNIIHVESDPFLDFESFKHREENQQSIQNNYEKDTNNNG